jgi:hypothetical protein
MMQTSSTPQMVSNTATRANALASCQLSQTIPTLRCLAHGAAPSRRVQALLDDAFEQRRE